MDVGATVAAGTAVVLAIVWLVRLEGRVNTQEELQKALKDDVEYIRERIDRAINGR